MPKKYNHNKIILSLRMFWVFLLITIFFSTCSENDSENNSGLIYSDSMHLSVRMADSEIMRLGNSLEFGKNNPDARWDYQMGLFLKALLDVWQKTGEKRYFDYSKRVIDSFLMENDSVRTYKMTNYNIDNINPGKVLLVLYKQTGDTKYKRAAEILFKQLENQPRTKEGGFWHKKRYPWQMWLDGTYMGLPFYARYEKMFEQPADYTDVINQVLFLDVHVRDPKTGLRYHGWDESNKQEWADPETGCSPNFWGRGMGWYAMALVDALDYIPADYSRRQQFIFIFNDLCKAIAKFQDSKTGLWYQVLDQADRDGNYFEASASCMFVYALAKGVRNGYLDKSYLNVAQKGYNGILKNLIRKDKKGLLTLTGICAVAGLGGDPYRDGSFDYYISEPVVNNDLKGVAPFIMASLQMEKKQVQISLH